MEELARRPKRRMNQPLLERVNERIDKSGGPDACWPWIMYRARFGHGIIGVLGGTMKAHRAAWTVFVGPIPDGMCVCHRCDNPPCCNPTHLFLGTIADNTADMIRKGRAVSLSGERNGFAKLREADVHAIRRRRAAGESYAAIARSIGVGHCAVRDVAIGKTWAHVQSVADE